MPTEILALWERVTICKVFPGYTLETARQAPAREMRRALALLDIARKTLEAKGSNG
ncbi:MAG: hypothetical protein ACYDHY_17460 [Acidiferrobacterales bacterium]